MFNRILVALKFGPASIFALKKSLEIAQDKNAEIHILHVLDYTLQQMDQNEPEFVDIKNEIKLQYTHEIEPLLDEAGEVTFKCLPSDPALEVCKHAQNIEADLIVMGCHQIKEKMCLGRIDYVGITILEKAPCPVLLVPFCD